MGRQGDFHATTQSRALNHRHNQLAASFNAVADIGQKWRQWRLAELANISASNKSLSLTHHQHSLDRSIRIGLLHRSDKTSAHMHAQGVDGRIVHRDDQYLALQPGRDYVLVLGRDGA